MEPLYLGLDGGGTGCRVLLAYRTGAPIGYGVGGPANPYTLGAEGAWRNIDEAVKSALRRAGLATKDRTRIRACFGLAGVDRPRDAEAFLSHLHPYAALRTVNDMHVALVGALGREEGVLLGAGTGSIAYAVDPTGKYHRAGGWGLTVGDEGSGAWLGLEAVRAAFWAFDGRSPETSLQRAVLDLWGPTMDDVLERVRTATPKEFGSFARIVLEGAAAGDAASQRLKREAVGALAALLWALDRKYPSGELTFSVTGSLGKRLLPEVLERAPERFCRGYTGPKGSAEEGALELARRL